MGMEKESWAGRKSAVSTTFIQSFCLCGRELQTMYSHKQMWNINFCLTKKELLVLWS